MRTICRDVAFVQCVKGDEACFQFVGNLVKAFWKKFVQFDDFFIGLAVFMAVSLFVIWLFVQTSFCFFAWEQQSWLKQIFEKLKVIKSKKALKVLKAPKAQKISLK